MAKKPWEAERDVSLVLARQLLEENFPGFHLSSLEPFGQGWDNVAYLANGEFVFRFPQRQLAVASIENEIRLLPNIARRVCAPIPLPHFVGKSTSEYDWPFYGYSCLRGQTACRAHLNSDERRAVAVPLAQFLKQLHAIDLSSLLPGVPPADPYRRSDVAYRATQVLSKFDELKAKGLYSLGDAMEGFVRSMISFIQPDNATGLLHGDFYCRHLIIGLRRDIVGVIDWGDLMVGYPALDLAIAHSFLPPAAATIFREAYGGIDDDLWLAARLFGIYYAALLSLYGHDIGDDDLVREAHLAFSYIDEALRHS